MQHYAVAQPCQNFGQPSGCWRIEFTYGKSRLPGQMSRRVEKPPACGCFGLVLVSYRPLALSARRLLFTAHLGA